MYVSAIIAAGGRGERLGAGIPKQLLTIGGRTLLERSLDAFLQSDRVDEVIVVLPPDLAASPPACLVGAAKPVRVVAGGPRRQDSVASGFAAVAAAAEIVVVHDAARPFVGAPLIARTIEAAIDAGAAIAALPSRDTVKRARERGSHAPRGCAAARPAPGPWVQLTLPREGIFLAQTPQAFRRDILRDALALGGQGVEATDEATLAERAGHPVRLVEGDARNIKITTEDDLAFARSLATGEPPPSWRVGVGFDVHRLVAGRPLILGGVEIPFDRGLAGHSDADAVCHAVTDALLGAAAAGDIGLHFPDTDERWKGASSLELLRLACGMVLGRGYRVENVDVVVLAERPSVGPHAERMRASLAVALATDIANVSVKGKTFEGLGDIGRGEAIAAHAVALLRRG